MPCIFGDGILMIDKRNVEMVQSVMIAELVPDQDVERGQTMQHLKITTGIEIRYKCCSFMPAIFNDGILINMKEKSRLGNRFITIC